MELWNGNNNETGFSINDFLTEAHRCGIPAVLYNFDNATYLIMGPNYDIIKSTIDRPNILRERIDKCEASKSRIFMYSQCIKVCENGKLICGDKPCNEGNAFMGYQDIMYRIQDYSIALHAFRFSEINPLPYYCWDSDCETFTDLNRKRTNPNVGQLVRDDYNKIFKDYAKRVADKSEQCFQNECNIKNNPTMVEKPKTVFISEWKKHEVDDIMHFVKGGTKMSQIRISDQMFDYFKEKMRGTEFVYYHAKDLDYELRDNSKFSKDLGNKNIWKNDGKCKFVFLIYPQEQERLVASWILEKKFHTDVYIDKYISPNYIPLDQLVSESESHRVVQKRVSEADFPNVISLTSANGIKVSCDFEGKMTRQNRTMKDTSAIPFIIKEEDIPKWTAMERRLQRERRDYIPIGHLDPVGTMEDELERKRLEKEQKKGFFSRIK